MFEDADPLNTGTLTYEALQNQLTKHGGLLENLSIRYIYKLLFIFLIRYTIILDLLIIYYHLALTAGWCQCHKNHTSINN